MNELPVVGTMLPRDLDTAQVVPFIQRAESLGFAELWVVEDLGWRGGIAQASVALAHSSTLRVGLGILPAGARNAAFAAMEAATLAQLYPGRVDLGFGHGMPNWMRSVGAWAPSPLRALERVVSDVRTLLEGRESRMGPDQDPVSLDASALPTTVPDLLLGVRGPKSLALSGRVADGTILAEPATPEYVAASRRLIDGPASHRIVTFNASVVDETTEAAIESVRPALEWIGDPEWAAHLVSLDFGAELTALRRRCASRKEFAAAMPSEWVQRLTLAGTAEAVRARIAALGEAGATSTVLVPVGADPLGALDSLATVVASA